MPLVMVSSKWGMGYERVDWVLQILTSALFPPHLCVGIIYLPTTLCLNTHCLTSETQAQHSLENCDDLI
jgi:hypothetical protein